MNRNTNQDGIMNTFTTAKVYPADYDGRRSFCVTGYVNGQWVDKEFFSAEAARHFLATQQGSS